MPFREKLILLHHCRGMTNRRIMRLLKIDPSLQHLFTRSVSDYAGLLATTPSNLSNFFHDLHSINVSSILEKYRNKNVSIVTYVDEEYPNKLKEIFDPPIVLYVKGDVSLCNKQKIIAVVGTRNPSSYGLLSVSEIVSPLARDGWVIVSGLAKGIDTAAHLGAISAKGQTIAVIGGGFDHIYPKENKGLSDRISQEQLLISEYPPDIHPQKWHFPARNRIISGLAKAVLVVEARERSGSLITADQALEQGRDVFAIPGSIFSSNSQGTNYLIQQGAKLITSAEDIMNEF